MRNFLFKPRMKTPLSIFDLFICVVFMPMLVSLALISFNEFLVIMGGLLLIYVRCMFPNKQEKKK